MLPLWIVCFPLMKCLLFFCHIKFFFGMVSYLKCMMMKSLFFSVFQFFQIWIYGDEFFFLGHIKLFIQSGFKFECIMINFLFFFSVILIYDQSQITSLPSILKQPVSGTSKMVCGCLCVSFLECNNLHSIQFWNVLCRIQEDGGEGPQCTQKWSSASAPVNLSASFIWIPPIMLSYLLPRCVVLYMYSIHFSFSYTK